MAAICTVFVYFVSFLFYCSICLYDMYIWYNVCDCHAIGCDGWLRIVSLWPVWCQVCRIAK